MTVTWLTWLMLTVALVATALVLMRLTELYRTSSADEQPGPRVRRRIMRKSVFAIGCWQLAIGVFLATHGSWSSSVALLVCGLGLMFGPPIGERLLRRLG